MVKISHNIFLRVCLVLSFFLHCRYPEGPENIDIVELEHVWQFCKAFSLYSERVPPRSNLLDYSTNYVQSNFLLDALYDTLFIYWKNEKIKIADYDRSYAAIHSRVVGSYNYTRSADTTVFFKKLTENTAYLKIKAFEFSTDKDVTKFNALVAGVQNIIIDLKGNGGGYIAPCKNIIELFLPSDIAYLHVDSMITSGNLFPQKDTAAKWISQKTGDAWEGKNITVLIDTLTASASEILTVALRDGLSSTYIIGTKSLGKAIGQILFQLKNDAGIFLTVMKFEPMNGVDYHEKGIIPDTLFTGSFDEELKAAGKRYEANFEELLDTAALKEVLTYNAPPTRSRIGNFGCYRVLDYKQLPQF